MNGFHENDRNSSDQDSNAALEIVFQDESLVAINKPAGLLVHRSRLDVHATEFAMQRLRDQIGQPVFPVHRLDRPTSGVLLFALDKTNAVSYTHLTLPTIYSV